MINNSKKGSKYLSNTYYDLTFIIVIIIPLDSSFLLTDLFFYLMGKIFIFIGFFHSNWAISSSLRDFLAEKQFQSPSRVLLNVSIYPCFWVGDFDSCLKWYIFLCSSKFLSSFISAELCDSELLHTLWFKFIQLLHLFCINVTLVVVLESLDDIQGIYAQFLYDRRK